MGRRRIPMHEKITSEQLQELVALVADGLSNIEIGKILFIPSSTVKHRLQIAQKILNAKNRAQLVAIAIRKGVI